MTFCRVSIANMKKSQNVTAKLSLLTYRNNIVNSKVENRIGKSNIEDILRVCVLLDSNQ